MDGDAAMNLWRPPKSSKWSAALLLVKIVMPTLLAPSARFRPQPRRRPPAVPVSVTLAVVAME